jgi:hypothetical protein
MVRMTYPSSHPYLLIILFSNGKEASTTAKETRLIIQHAANSVDEIKCSSSPNFAVQGNDAPSVDIFSTYDLLVTMQLGRPVSELAAQSLVTSH